MNQRKVLIVDDDPLICSMIEKELKRNHFDAHCASNGIQALDELRSNTIDILVLDYRLPDKAGLEVLQKMREENISNCQTIVVTGYGSQDIALQSLKLGALDYVEKPIQMEDLLTAIGRAEEKMGESKPAANADSILIIDASPQILQHLSETFQNRGYQTYTALNGAEGFSLLEQKKIDVLICSVALPDMNGIDFFCKAKRLFTAVEGIFLIQNSEQETALRALRCGAFDYLIIPVHPEKIEHAVQMALEHRDLIRNKLFRHREKEITSEIIHKINEELETRIEEKTKENNKIQVQLFQTSKLATLGEMAAGLAHEMNQPLGGIGLVIAHCSKLLELGKLTPTDLENALKDIDASVKRMTKVIHHIRTFARQDNFIFIKVQINDTVHSALNLLGEQLRLHGIAVTLQLSDVPIMIGEPYQLEQVWINLLTNARDALDTKEEWIKHNKISAENFLKTIRIHTAYQAETKTIFIEFEDNGIGIPTENLSKILEPFFTTKEVGKATGLGLSISYSILERHKGRMDIQSAVNEYTLVRIEFPVEEG